MLEVVEQEEKLCDEVETVWKFMYLGDRVNAVGGCKASVSVRTRCGWVRFMECGELLYCRIFPLMLKDALHKNYIRPAILYGSEAWCLKECDMETFQRTEISMVRAMCRVQLKDEKRSTNLMFMLGLKEPMDELAMINSVHWCSHVSRREDGHVLRRALDFEVEGQWKKGR